jgi:hypothetical protein
MGVWMVKVLIEMRLKGKWWNWGLVLMVWVVMLRCSGVRNDYSSVLKVEIV